MSAVIVRRADITVREDSVAEGPYGKWATQSTSWSAEFAGNLSTGEWVTLSRYGSTFAQALERLEAAIAEQGWVIE